VCMFVDKCVYGCRCILLGGGVPVKGGDPGLQRGLMRGSAGVYTQSVGAPPFAG
jgi:hypothetical protein